MATVLGLAMRLTADSSGMAAGLSEAEKQIKNLRASTDGIVSLFDKFAGSSDAAAAAQADVARQILLLTSAFKEGLVDAQGLAQGLAEIGQEARALAGVFADGAATTARYATEEERAAASLAELDAQLAAGAISSETHARAVADVTGETARAAAAQEAHAAALREGAAVTEKYATEEERTAAALAKLDQQLADGAISAETHARAVADVTGETALAKKAEEELAAAMKRAGDITKANLTPTQKYDQEVAELEAHLAAGRISQETFNAALQKAANQFAKAELAAAKYDTVAEGAGSGATLKFNELSGALAAIPGPIGNVAGRLSGLTSAGEGLSKIFSGGLSAGLGNIGTTVAGLVNPFTAAAVGVAAFAAGAVAVAKGLASLSDRVEGLGFQAEKLGTSFEFIQVLETAAERSGSSIDALGSAFNKSLKAIDAARNGSAEAAAGFAKIGITVEDLQNSTPEEIFKRTAKALAEIEDPAARAAAAAAIFGKSGADLIPTFTAIADSEKDLRRFYAVMTDIEKVRLDEFDSSLERLSSAGRGLSQNLIAPFAGLGSGIADGVAEFTAGVTAIVRPIMQVLEPVFTSIGQVIEVVGVIIGGIGRQLGAVLAPIGNLAQAIGGFNTSIGEGLVEAIRWLVDSSVAVTEFIVSWSPVQLIADLIGDLSSQVGEFGTTAMEYLEPVIAIVERIGTIFATVFGNISTYVSDAISRVGTVIQEGVSAFLQFTGLAGVIEAFASAVSSAFSAIWDGIKAVISSVGGFIERVVKFAEDWLGIKSDVEDAPIQATIEVETQGATLAATQFSKEIGDAATKAAEFGDAGFQAALRYQEQLEMIAQLQADGELTADEAKRAAEQQKKAFEENIAALDEQQKAQQKAADEAEKARQKEIDAANKAAEADRKRAEAFMQEQGIGGTKEEEQAQETLLAITRQIEETQKAIAAAREAGDAEAEKSATRQLALLDQAQAAAQDQVEFGFTAKDAQDAIDKVRSDIEEGLADAIDLGGIGAQAAAELENTLAELEGQLQLKIIDPEQFEAASREAKKVFDERVKQAQEVAKLEEQYAEKRAEIENERLAELAQISQQPLQATDMRTSEGASQFLALATGREDPAIAEYRKQVAELKKIQDKIDKIGGTVEIVGGA